MIGVRNIIFNISGRQFAFSILRIVHLNSRLVAIVIIPKTMHHNERSNSAPYLWDKEVTMDLKKIAECLKAIGYR